MANDEEYFRESVGKFILRKARRYVSDPSDAPDGVDVQEGPQGGYYYETGSGSSGGSEEGEDWRSEDPDPDEHNLPVDELVSNYESGDSVTLTTNRMGEVSGTFEGFDYDDSFVWVDDKMIPVSEIEDVGGGSEEGGESEDFDPQRLWNEPVVVHEEMYDDELKEYASFLWDLHDEAREEDDDETMQEVLDELREVDRELLSRE